MDTWGFPTQFTVKYLLLPCKKVQCMMEPQKMPIIAVVSVMRHVRFYISVFAIWFTIFLCKIKAMLARLFNSLQYKDKFFSNREIWDLKFLSPFQRDAWPRTTNGHFLGLHSMYKLYNIWNFVCIVLIRCIFTSHYSFNIFKIFAKRIL